MKYNKIAFNCITGNVHKLCENGNKNTSYCNIFPNHTKCITICNLFDINARLSDRIIICVLKVLKTV